MLGDTYTVNFWDFFSEGLNCRAMTEQKTRVAKPRHIGVTLQFQAPPSLHNTANCS